MTTIEQTEITLNQTLHKTSISVLPSPLHSLPSLPQNNDNINVYESFPSSFGFPSFPLTVTFPPPDLKNIQRLPLIMHLLRATRNFKKQHVTNTPTPTIPPSPSTSTSIQTSTLTTITVLDKQVALQADKIMAKRNQRRQRKLTHASKINISFSINKRNFSVASSASSSFCKFQRRKTTKINLQNQQNNKKEKLQSPAISKLASLSHKQIINNVQL